MNEELENEVIDEMDEVFEGGEDAACGRGCGMEPMGCARCPEMGYGDEAYAYGDYDDAMHW